MNKVQQLEAEKARIDRELEKARLEHQQESFHNEDKMFQSYFKTLSDRKRVLAEHLYGELNLDIQELKEKMEEFKGKRGRYYVNAYWDCGDQQDVVTEKGLLALAEEKLNSRYDEGWDCTIVDLDKDKKYQLTDLVKVVLK